LHVHHIVAASHSAVRHLVPTAIVRRAIMGLLVGPTVVAIVDTSEVSDLRVWSEQTGRYLWHK
jgi:hypothetical protein